MNLPTIPGRVWNTTNLYIDGSVSVALAGDYNGDDSVDAADYVVWRKTDNTPAGYNSWRTNFGATAASGPNLDDSASIPEPTSALLLSVVFAAIGICSGRVNRAIARETTNG